MMYRQRDGIHEDALNFGQTTGPLPALDLLATNSTSPPIWYYETTNKWKLHEIEPGVVYEHDIVYCVYAHKLCV